MRGRTIRCLKQLITSSASCSSRWVVFGVDGGLEIGNGVAEVRAAGC